MTTMGRDRLVDDYLRRLEAAAAHLPRARRRELVCEIEEHVDAALAETGDDETAVRNVLERLGSPEEIAAAAGAPPERGRLELAALIVLWVSFVFPVGGYVIGAGLVLGSKAWKEREKLIGLVLAPIVVIAVVTALIGAANDGYSAESEDGAFLVTPDPTWFAFVAVVVLSGPLAALYLAFRLKRARAA